MTLLYSLPLSGHAFRYKAYQRVVPQWASASTGGSCVVEVPYPTSPVFEHEQEAAGGDIAVAIREVLAQSRPTLVHFAGALDVCCGGTEIRCAIGRMLIAAQYEADLVIRPTIPTNDSHRGPCTQWVLSHLTMRGQKLAPGVPNEYKREQGNSNRTRRSPLQREPAGKSFKQFLATPAALAAKARSLAPRSALRPLADVGAPPEARLAKQMETEMVRCFSIAPLHSHSHNCGPYPYVVRAYPNHLAMLPHRPCPLSV